MPTHRPTYTLILAYPKTKVKQIIKIKAILGKFEIAFIQTLILDFIHNRNHYRGMSSTIKE